MEAVPARVLAEPERRVRVRDDVRVRLVLEPARLEELPRPRDTFLAVAGEQLLARQALGRVLGVEDEREPGDVGAEPALEPGGRWLGRSAEGSDVVRPDRDDVVAHHATVPTRLSRNACRPATETDGPAASAIPQEDGGISTLSSTWMTPFEAATSAFTTFAELT